jgi:hypothetical protein
MNKIIIKDPATLEQDYLTKMVEPLLERIKFLKITLSHLELKSTVIERNGIKSYKPMTATAIAIIENKAYGNEGAFNAPNYLATLASYFTGSNKLGLCNLYGLRRCLSDLTADNAQMLEMLLVCPPEIMKEFSVGLLESYNLGDKEAKILGLAFDYDHKDLSGAAKEVFRTHDLVGCCPYCNREDAACERSEEGLIVVVHQLDHFFNKAADPLLSLSMYNLIPCGQSCNSSTNKGDIPFKDHLHLNPYIDGFNDAARYYPILQGKVVTKIGLSLQCAPDSPRRLQLVGGGNMIDESLEDGNINVFKLRGKYAKYKKKAGKILKKVDDKVSGLRWNNRLIDKLRRLDRDAAYKAWYDDVFDKPFEPERFNEEMLSKFTRDIHDFYINKHGRDRSEFIKELIKFK